MCKFDLILLGLVLISCNAVIIPSWYSWSAVMADTVQPQLWYSLPPAGGCDNIPFPAQKQCPNIEARKMSGAGNSDGLWVLAKAMKMPNPLPTGYNIETNFCSPFSYIPDVCGCVSMTIKAYKDNSMTLQTYGHSMHTKSFMHFGANVEQTDDYYAVFQGKPDVMEEFDEDGDHKVISPIPQIITDSQGVMFAKVAKDSTDEWMIYTTCDSNEYTWVLLSAGTLVNETHHKELVEEYEKALVVLGVDLSRLVNVPVEQGCIDIAT